MSRLLWRTVAVVAALGSMSLAPGPQQSTWPTEAPPAPLPAKNVKFPPYEVRTLANGLQVLVVSQSEQPAVNFRLLVRAGAAQEPVGRPGVASFVASLLDQGTTTKSATQIATAIDSAGGILGVSSGNELTHVSGAVVKDQADLALALVADLARNPAFSAEEIALQRKQMLSGLQVGYDDPDYLADAAFGRLVFGAHPYGRPGQGTLESIERITQADLQTFHRTWFAPNNALLAIVGDLTPAEAFAAAERAFGNWPRREVPTVTMPEAPVPARKVVIIDRPGSAQTEIRVGHVSIARTHADYIPFDMAIRILGGEGANRLFGVLRSDRALTYGASADLNSFRSGGVVVAETDTRSAATGESLRLMVDEFTRLQRETVHPAELRGAQDFMAGNFPLSIETSSAIAEQVLARLFYGQSLAEIDTYLDRVSQVTPAAIQRVARQLLKPDQLTIVLVGDAATFVNQLRSVGFSDFDRISIADLDLDSPALRRTAGARTTAR